MMETIIKLKYFFVDKIIEKLINGFNLYSSINLTEKNKSILIKLFDFYECLLN